MSTSAFLASLLLVVLFSHADVSGTACDPAVKNCLQSCKTSCRTAKCRYNCHYDTTVELLKMAITPPGGASLDAFFAAVAKLGNIFEDNTVVRIEPLGIYKGKVEVGDYIATFVHPLGPSSRARINGIDITHFANTGDVSALTFNLMYARVNDPSQTITNLTGTMFNTYNSTSEKIIQGDWNFIRMPQMQEQLFFPDGRVSDNTSAVMIRAVCGVNEQVCRPQGVSGYTNVTECLAFMASIPRIAPYGIQGNNQYCRFLHMAYATVDPKVHCPHMGMSGGGVCVNQVYNDYYKVFPRGIFVGKL